MAFNKKTLHFFCGIGIFSFFYYLTYFNYGINLSDEGYLVYGAERVLSGQLPGADFHAYMPGRYLVLAALFKIFGAGIVVERVMWVVVRIFIVLLYCQLSLTLVPRSIAFIPSFLLIILPGPWHKSFELLFPLIWLIAVYFYLYNSHLRSALILGLTVGITLFFRIEIGLIVFGLSGVAISFKKLYLRNFENRFNIRNIRSKSDNLHADV